MIEFPDDGAKPEDDDISRAIAREVAAMPPGSFKHSDDPCDYAEDRGDAPKPKPGSGHHLGGVEVNTRLTQKFVGLLEQRDTPEGRLQADMTEALILLNRIAEGQKPQTVGAPVDVLSKLIETQYAWNVEAVHTLVTNVVERVALLETLKTVRNKMLLDVAVSRRPHNPNDAVKSRNKRSRKGKEGS